MSFDAGFNEKDLVLSEGLSYKERVLKYHDVYQDILDAYSRVEDEVLAAKQARSFDRYEAVEPEHDRISVLLLPFVSGHQEALRLAEKGYKLADWEGHLTPEPTGAEVA